MFNENAITSHEIRSSVPDPSTALDEREPTFLVEERVVTTDQLAPTVTEKSDALNNAMHLTQVRDKSNDHSHIVFLKRRVMSTFTTEFSLYYAAKKMRTC
jgi:hypothetical protein